MTENRQDSCNQRLAIQPDKDSIDERDEDERRTMTNPKKRILFLVGATSVYGAEIAMLGVMRGLKKKGYEIHCITSGWSDGDFESRLQNEGISYTSLKLGFLYLSKPLWTLDTLWNLPSAFLQFYKLKKAFNPSYVYCLSYRSIIMLYPLISEENTIHHVEDVIPGTWLNSLFYFIVKGKVAHYIAASNAVRKSLLLLDVPDCRVSVVLNGVSDFAPHCSCDSGYDKEGFVIGIIGQIIKRKGHIILIEALNILKQLRSDFVCRIVGRGDPEYIKEINSLVRQYKLDAVVRWADYVTNQNELYQGLDVVVIPSYDDACPLVALEASLYGIPVIASRVGGLPEIVQDGTTGFLFESGNCKELAEKILLLMEDIQLREEVGKAARRYAFQNFTEEIMCDRIESALLTAVCV